MSRKTISNTFTVSTVEDGVNTPFYNEEWYAWSNVESTVDATKSPFEEPYAGWSESIPQQGSYAYLWKKIVKYTYNEATGQYDQEPAQYFRMSGTNGTSINVKGTIDYAYNSSGVFPPPTSGLNGRRAIAKEDNKIWVCQQVQPNQYVWTPSGNTASDGFSYTVVQGNFNGNYQSTSVLTGHLVMWSNAASDWIDLGKFKGENGTTYYTHYAWATDVVFAAGTLPIPAGQTNRPNSTSVTGGSLEPSEDGSKPYMGILIDTKVSASTVYENYTWSYAKGDKGDTGKVGRFFYYGGVFDSTDTTKEFVVNDAQVPFFEHTEDNQKRYSVYNPDTNPAGGVATMHDMWQASGGSWSYAPWEPMENSFPYLISEAIFAAFAKLGSFIVSGDWLISTNGVIGITEYVDGALYRGAAAYTWFDPNSPDESFNGEHTNGGTTWNEWNFVPYLAFDGRSGATYQQNAHVKGEIKATTGTIGGFIITPTQIKSTNEKIILNNDGSATLTNATISGTINASTINGQVSINTNGSITVGTTKKIVIGQSSNNGYIKLLNSNNEDIVMINYATTSGNTMTGQVRIREIGSETNYPRDTFICPNAVESVYNYKTNNEWRGDFSHITTQVGNRLAETEYEDEYVSGGQGTRKHLQIGINTGTIRLRAFDGNGASAWPTIGITTAITDVTKGLVHVLTLNQLKQLFDTPSLNPYLYNNCAVLLVRQIT